MKEYIPSEKTNSNINHMYAYNGPTFIKKSDAVPTEYNKKYFAISGMYITIATRNKPDIIMSKIVLSIVSFFIVFWMFYNKWFFHKELFKYVTKV